MMVGIASLLSIPWCTTAIFFCRVWSIVRSQVLSRFCKYHLTGVPSIIAGVFAYGVIVLTTKEFLLQQVVSVLAVIISLMTLTAERFFKTYSTHQRLARRLELAVFKLPFASLLLLPIPAITTGILLLQPAQLVKQPPSIYRSCSVSRRDCSALLLPYPGINL